MIAQPQTTLSPEEYLALERSGSTKHEYYAGEIVAMVGASKNHNVITGNIFASLHRQLRRRLCDVYPSDMRVGVGTAGLYMYPDLTVVCGTPRFADNQQDTLLNPTIIVEVLSPSTENYDRGKKFLHYRTLDSLQEYILIAHDTPRIEHYIRQTDNHWLLATTATLDSAIRLPSIECEVLLSDVYEKVLLDESRQHGRHGGR